MMNEPEVGGMRQETERDQQGYCAQDSRRVFVPRDDILNICFVEHEYYFVACLTVRLKPRLHQRNMYSQSIRVSGLLIH